MIDQRRVDETDPDLGDLEVRIRRMEFLLGLRGNPPCGNYYPGDQLIDLEDVKRG
jgi:hypothetical protein